MNVFDSSAILAFLGGEPGADVVQAELDRGGVCGAANWSEVAQKVRSRGGDWRSARGLLLSYPLMIESVVAADAELAAALWRRGSGLSLADRCCLALRHRVGGVAWTADTEWAGQEGVRLIRG